MVLPILSLRFIEDLSVAYDWRFLNGYSLEPIDEHVAMLKVRRPEDFPGGRVPDPRTASGVPSRNLEQDGRAVDVGFSERRNIIGSRKPP